MRILMIGGTRFMGPYILKNLHATGHEVAFFHRGQTSTSIALPEGVEEMLGDRDQLADYASTLRAWQPDIVLDMMQSTEKQAQQFVEVFAGFTRRTMVTSSLDVYRSFGRVNYTEGGEVDPAPITEDSSLRENLYPHRNLPDGADYDKILVERVIMSRPELPSTILRLPAVYGPGDFLHRMFPYLKRMLDDRPAIVLEERVANWRWAHGYVENMADAIALAVTDERASGRIYNVAEPFALSMSERVEQIAKAADWHGRVVVLPTERLPEALRVEGNFAQDIIVDSSRIRQELGYNERIDLTEAFRRTIAWERTNPPEKIDPNLFNYAAEDEALAGL